MTSFKFSWQDICLYLVLFGCWLIGSSGQILKNLPHRAGLVYLAGALAVAVTLAILRWLQSRGSGQIGWGWIAALLIVLAALYFVLYPISQRHTLGVGSDGEDALRITASRVLHGEYPYYAKTYLGNAISPMPGAVFLAIPFYLLGRVSLQNLAWLVALAVVCTRFFRLRATVAAFLVILVLGSASTLDAFVVGNDYVTNVWYMFVLAYAFVKTFEQNPGGWRHILSSVLLGLALGSRPTFVVFPRSCLPICCSAGAEPLLRGAVSRRQSLWRRR